MKRLRLYRLVGDTVIPMGLLLGMPTFVWLLIGNWSVSDILLVIFIFLLSCHVHHMFELYISYDIWCKFFFNKLNMKQTERAALSFGHVVHQDDVHASTSSHSTASLRSLPGGRDGCYLRLLGGAPVRWRSWFISQSSLRFIGDISYIYI